MKRGKKLISLGIAVILGLSLILIPIASRLSPVQAAVTWTKSSEEVTLDSELYVVDAWVIKEDSTTYKMWYTHGKTGLSLTDIANDLLALNLDDIIDDIASLDLVQLLSDLSALNAADILDFLDDASTVIGYAASSDGITWNKVNSLALEGSGGSAWDSVGAPCVIKDGTTYKMWYTNSKTDLTQVKLQSILTDLGNSDPDVVKAAILDLYDGTSTVIGYATSDNGADWTPVNPEVFAGSNSVFGSVGAPCVIKDDATYKMWYTRAKTDLTQASLQTILDDIRNFGINDLLGLLDGTSTVIGYATSPDGLDWTVQNDEAHAGSGAAWDSVADPSVVKTDSAYEMWYTNGTTDLTATDLPTLLDEIIELNLTDLWDTLEAQGLSQFLTELLTLNLSNIKSLLDGTSSVIGYATSNDGIIWTPQTAPDIVGSSGSPWSSVAAPSVVKTGSRYEMWYTEGIEDLTFANLFDLVFGVDLPIGYASYSPLGGGFGGGGLPFQMRVDLMGLVEWHYIDFWGSVMEDIERTSGDGKLTITIPTGTIAKDAEGAVLLELVIAVDESPPPLPADAIIIGPAYNFEPTGATFNPSMIITFNYSLPEDVDEESLFIAYYDVDTGKWVELDSVIDTEANTITAEVSHITTFAVLGYEVEVAVPPVIPPLPPVVVPPVPATFTLSSLTVSPTEVDIGEEITVSALIANTGDLTGTYEVNLKIDDVVVATKEVTLAGGASQKVTFTTSKDVAGTYSVNVCGLTGSFAVKAPPINWWLIGGIIAGVIIIAVVVWQVTTRR